MKRRLALLLTVGLVAAAVWFSAFRGGPDQLVLTGVVTTDHVNVSPQVGGRVTDLRVKEGQAVKRGEIVAVIEPDELQAERAYYSASASGVAAQVKENEAALRYEERQTTDQIRQAEAVLASMEAQQAGVRAELENARSTLKRAEELAGEGLTTAQNLDGARAAFDTARSRIDALVRQMEAQRAAVALARSNVEQIGVRRSQLQTSEHQLAAADAQRTKADVRLGYTEIRAPADGVVDVRVARPGEVVTSGEVILTLLDPDDLWVRADLEETYIDRVRLGDTLTVRLPSGEERVGTVIFRAVDAGFATQRDVSRTKRDIRTFEIRLRVDNADRRLAVGMTAYVLVPIGG